MGSTPLWLFDLIVYLIGAVIVAVIVAWLRAAWRQPDVSRTHGQSGEGQSRSEAGGASSDERGRLDARRRFVSAHLHMRRVTFKTAREVVLNAAKQIKGSRMAPPTQSSRRSSPGSRR